MLGHVMVLCTKDQIESTDRWKSVEAEARQVAAGQGAELVLRAPDVQGAGFVAINGEMVDLSSAGLIAVTFTMERA